MTLTALPPSRIPHEWEAIRGALKRAIERDPGRKWFDVLAQALSGALTFWRVPGGYLATQMTREPGTMRRAWWVIYAGGFGGSLADKRALMGEIEAEASRHRCTEVRFEGRDWRKVFPDYQARKGADGRWNFRKALA